MTLRWNHIILIYQSHYHRIRSIICIIWSRARHKNVKPIVYSINPIIRLYMILNYKSGWSQLVSTCIYCLRRNLKRHPQRSSLALSTFAAAATPPLSSCLDCPFAGLLECRSGRHSDKVKVQERSSSRRGVSLLESVQLNDDHKINYRIYVTSYKASSFFFCLCVLYRPPMRCNVS